MLGFSRPDWDAGEEFAVMGIVDLDAVPAEKRHLPLGEDDNPIHLIEFANVRGKGTSSTHPHRRAKATRQSGSPRQKHKKKHHR